MENIERWARETEWLETLQSWHCSPITCLPVDSADKGETEQDRCVETALKGPHNRNYMSPLSSLAMFIFDRGFQVLTDKLLILFWLIE